MDISQLEADALITERKVVTGNINWRLDGQGYKMTELVVLAVESGELLRLRGRVGHHNRGFTLLYKNSPIRRLSFHPKHRNPGGELIRGPHKHLWYDDYEDSIAYVPSDIMFGNWLEELQGFLKECNIEFTGTIQAVGLGAVS